MKNFFLVLIAVNTIIFYSCKNKGNLKDDDQVLVFDINGLLIENHNGILAFESENKLYKALGKLSKLSSTKENVESGAIGTSSGIPGFRSLYDVFTEAMEEAEYYYEKEGGYEAFKEKYASLYFPEEKDDYAAYLPVSDVNMAKIIDVNGNVIVAGEIRNMKDIDSYRQLKELGITAPEDGEINLKSAINGHNNIYGIKNDKENVKLWVRTDKKFQVIDSISNYPVLCLEIGFRKKGMLGKWYNYASKSAVPKNTVRNIHILTDSIKAASPHIYIFPIETYQQAREVHYYAHISGEIDIAHPDMNGKLVTLTVEYNGSLWRPSLKRCRIRD